MEQRTLRLGDIVDDYCPRERRITNHAIVAIVEDAIRQTRCTTCDHEHVYKHAREPRRRKASNGALFEQVLADVSGGQPVVSRPEPVAPIETGEPEPLAAAPADPPAPAHGEPPAPREDGELWPAHRTLIRATLPRLTDDPPAPRPIPEFTMHQRPQKGRHQRNVRLMYGPQGDPFGRQPPPSRGAVQNGNGNGSGDGAQGAGKPRRRRRGGKRR